MMNPFAKKVLYDENDFKNYPFILTNSIKLLKNKIETTTKDDGYSDYILLLGERGIGKTTTLLYLKTVVAEIASIKTKYFRSVAGLGSLYGIASNLFSDKRSLYFENPKNLRDFLSKDRYFFFIDVPDEIDVRKLQSLAHGLEILLGFKNINVVIAMNYSHYYKMNELSEILGKYMVWNLKPFTFEETVELIIERLKLSDVELKTETYPFTMEAIEKIYEYSKGIPRNVLSACDLLFQKFLVEKKEITRTVAEKELSTSYAEKIIRDRAPPHLQQPLLDLYYLLLPLKKEKEKSVHRLVEEKFGWSYVTRRKRLRMLEKFGLVRILKDPIDNWTNIVEVV